MVVSEIRNYLVSRQKLPVQNQYKYWKTKELTKKEYTVTSGSPIPVVMNI